MCIDNPREGFGELFDTHPTVDSRVAALVKFAGGHDPGRIALAPPASDGDSGSDADQPPPGGPWGSANTPAEDGPWGPASGNAAGEKPLQQPSPSLESDSPSPAPLPGPWGPHDRN
jgi:heat shock protein HtpX